MLQKCIPKPKNVQILIKTVLRLIVHYFLYRLFFSAMIDDFIIQPLSNIIRRLINSKLIDQVCCVLYFYLIAITALS